MKKYLKLAKNKLMERLLLLVLVLALANYVFFPRTALADTELANIGTTTVNFSYQFAPDNQNLSLIQIFY